MEEKEQSDAVDNPEIISPFANPPATDVYDEIGSTSRNSLESEEQRPALSQRLAEAFREGIASAKPDYEKRPEVRIPPPVQTHLQKDRQQSGDGGAMDRIIQEGGSAVSLLYDKAAGALDSAARLAKTAPAISTRWAEAFREGFTSVRTREVKVKKDRTAYPVDRQQSGDRGIMASILQVGGSAVEVLRNAVASVQPGDGRGIEKKIRMAEKKIKDLYVEIGHDAVGSWSQGGPIETQRLDELLEELRRNKEGIQNLREHSAGPVASAVIPADAGIQKPDWMPDQVRHDAQYPASCGEVVYSPASPPAPVQAVDAEAAPQDAGSDEADQARPEEPKARREKKKTRIVKKR
jgi:hypothetical protein